MRRIVMVGFLYGMLFCCTRSGYGPETPEMELSSDLVRFSARIGEIVIPERVSLSEAHGLDQPWESTASAGWLTVDPPRGSGAQEVLIGVATRGLAPGFHRAEVTFTPLSDLAEAQGALLIVELTLEAPGWTRLGGPLGGDIRSLAVDPQDPERVLAGNLSGDLFVSNDGGDTFQLGFEHVNPEENQAITAISILPSGRAYLALDGSRGGGVYRSDDRGNSWTPTGLQNLSVTSIAARDDDFVLADGDGLWRTEDGGATWDRLDFAEGSHFAAKDPDRPDGFVVGGSAGMINLTDGYTNTPVSTGQEERVLGFAASESGNWFLTHYRVHGQVRPLLISRDSGLNWEPAGGAGLPLGVSSRSFRIFADGDRLWGMQMELYLSEDQGETFMLVPRDYAPFNDFSQYLALASHPDGTLVSHESEGVLRHSGGGVVQMEIMSNSVEGLSWDSDRAVLTGVFTPGGVFRKSLDGEFVGLGGSGLNCAYFYSLSVDPRNPMVMLVGSRYCQDYYRTENSGGDWTGMAPGLAGIGHGIRRIVRAPENPDVLWVAAASEGLYYSTDAGLSFTKVPAVRVYQVAALSADAALFVDQEVGGISRHQISTGSVSVLVSSSNSPDFLRRTQDGSIWFNQAYGELQRSRDDGQTSEPMGFGGRTPTCIASDPADPNHIFIGFSDGLFETKDDGASWEEVGAPFRVRSLTIDESSGDLYVGTGGGGVYRYIPGEG